MEKLIDILKWVIAFFLSVFIGALGGADNLLKLIIVMVCADEIAGILKGIKQNNFSSSILFWGLINKAFEFCVIAVMYRVDLALGVNILRNTFIIWFSICEGASIIENSAVIGISWPDGLLKVLIQVRKGFSINISKIVKKIIEEYIPESEREEKE